MNAFGTLTLLPLADGLGVVGWSVIAILTFLLIGLPTLYAFVLTLAADDRAFDRSVREIEQFVKARARAQASRGA
jgi:hypothetical protein